MKMDSLEKKLKQIAWHSDCITEVVELETALKELGKVATIIDINGKTFMKVLKQEIQYFASSGKFDDLEAYQKNLREIMSYVKHFIKQQKRLLVGESKNKIDVVEEMDRMENEEELHGTSYERKPEEKKENE